MLRKWQILSKMTPGLRAEWTGESMTLLGRWLVGLLSLESCCGRPKLRCFSWACLSVNYYHFHLSLFHCIISTIWLFVNNKFTYLLTYWEAQLSRRDTPAALFLQHLTCILTMTGNIWPWLRPFQRYFSHLNLFSHLKCHVHGLLFCGSEVVFMWVLSHVWLAGNCYWNCSFWQGPTWPLLILLITNRS